MRRGLAVVAAGALVCLAAIEAVVALTAPARAPSNEDWQAASEVVRAGHAPGDLIVAAPAWADQVMRSHLGALISVPMAGRLDDARYSRVWEISQRGARAPEARGRLAQEREQGALTVRLWEREAPFVHFDFTAQWPHAAVSRRAPGQPAVPCDQLPDRHQCPGIGYNFLRPAVLEIGNTLRWALYAQPVPNAAVVAEWREVTLGRTLAVGAGLHHVWFRKHSRATVTLRVFVDEELVLEQTSGNRTGWQVDEVDTSKRAGEAAAVRFEITSPNPYSRHFGFAAEARG